MKALRCRECGREYPLEARHVCEFDFGPLEVVYDYARVKKTLTRAAIAKRPQSMWRYRELLPVAKEPTVGLEVGFTPLIKAAHMAEAFHLNFEMHHGGNSLNNIAQLHVIMAMKNCEFLEVLLPDVAQKYGISEDIEVDSNGMAHASDKVGIGAEIDFAMIEKMKAAELS